MDFDPDGSIFVQYPKDFFDPNRFASNPEHLVQNKGCIDNKIQIRFVKYSAWIHGYENLTVVKVTCRIW